MNITTALVVGILILAYALVWVTRRLTDAQEAIDQLVVDLLASLELAKEQAELTKSNTIKIGQLEAEIEQLKAAQPAKRIA